MTTELLKNKVQEILPPKRYKHTLAVYDTAIELANRYGEDVDKVATAALLHDIAKFLPDDEMSLLLTENGKADYLGHSPLVWHAPVG
ncbi:MAG: HD domain-containing protein, partial [Turicibacter sp.]